MRSPGRRRIVYGVHGYGRGHAARAQAVLPELTRRHEVLVLAGDDAYDQLHRQYVVVRIPTLRYHQGRGGRRSARVTIQRNITGVLDLLLGGPTLQMVRDEMSRFGPDVVVSDSEAWTHRAARSLGIPRISFDHYGIMACCRLEGLSAWDRAGCWIESLAYRALVCRPERMVVAAFYPATPRRKGVRVVGPILRQEVRQTRPLAGEHLLVYFSNARSHFTPRVEQALRGLDVPVRVYGLADRIGREGGLEFRPAGNMPFVKDLSSCRAVYATAGNQLVSEAIHFGKPLLLMPEDSLEQQLNARYVARWRIGMHVRPAQVSEALLERFLGRVPQYAANIASHRRDGLAEALAAIEEAIDERAGPAA